MISRLERLQEMGVLSRVGPVFDHARAGASLLAAVAVPEAERDAFAELINAAPGVNHNYAREHDFNLWFVMTAPDEPELEARLDALEARLGVPILRLPMLGGLPYRPVVPHSLGRAGARMKTTDNLEFAATGAARHAPSAEAERRLRGLLEQGLPLVPRPWRTLAEQAGMAEDQVMACVRRWQADGMIKRLGLVVKHRRLGIQANAMVVWNVPDERVAEVGRRLAHETAVTLCYRRPRRLPDWPYNLFCMIHGARREPGRWRSLPPSSSAWAWVTWSTACCSAPMPIASAVAATCARGRHDPR